MHKHAPCDTIIRDHPLIRRFSKFLSKRGLDGKVLAYIKPRLFFVYPRTLWIKLNDGELGPILPLEEFDPVEFARAIGACTGNTEQAFRRIVFDLRGRVAWDHHHLLAMIRTIDAVEHTYLILPEGSINSFSVIRDRNVFTNEQHFMQKIRNELDPAQICRLPLPSHFTATTLDDLLKKHASSTKLGAVDVIRWDFGAVEQTEPEVLSLISPIVHSFAHAYGILAAVDGVSPKLENRIRRVGALRPMASYFIKRNERLFEEEDASDRLPMKTYTDEEAFAVQDLCAERFLAMLSNNSTWFYSKADLTHSKSQRENNQKALEVRNVVQQFRQIIRELVENASYHSHGLGYITVELDARSRGHGLFIYVGDTGVGFAKGLSHAYKMKVGSDAQAVKNFINMVEFQHLRKVLEGVYDSGGRGLGRVCSILEKLGGTLTVRSGAAKAVFIPHKGKRPIELHSRMHRIQGTHIHIFIPSERFPA